MVQTTQPVTATAKALGTPEIIANILVLLPAKDILISAPRVNHTFNTTIKEFPALRKKLFFSVDVTDAKGKGSSQKVSGGANTFFFPNQHTEDDINGVYGHVSTIHRLFITSRTDNITDSFERMLFTSMASPILEIALTQYLGKVCIVKNDGSPIFMGDIVHVVRLLHESAGVQGLVICNDGSAAKQYEQAFVGAYLKYDGSKDWIHRELAAKGLTVTNRPMLFQAKNGRQYRWFCS